MLHSDSDASGGVCVGRQRLHLGLCSLRSLWEFHPQPRPEDAWRLRSLSEKGIRKRARAGRRKSSEVFRKVLARAKASGGP